MTKIMKLSNISFKHSNSDALILNDINFELNNHEIVAITGHNGAGKTTLFNIILGLIRPLTGKITIFGRNVSRESDFQKVRQEVALLLQDSDDQLFCPTVLEELCFGPLNQGKSIKDAKSLAKEILKELDIIHLENSVTYNLSGGEKRLVALASLITMKPKLMLLDEPTTGLDEQAYNKLIKYLSELKIPMIIISHDKDFISRISTKTIELKNGFLHL